MGAAVGGRVHGDVVWAFEGRSAETRARATAFRDVGSLALVSVRKPTWILLDLPAARCVRWMWRAPVSASPGIYVDANAISPAHAAEIAALYPQFVDGGIIGGA